MIIGVDFGTCFSSIAVMDGKIAKDNMTGDLEQILGNTSLGIPSLFMYSKEQKQEVYGVGCTIANPHENPEVIKYMKREVRMDPENIKRLYESGGRKFILEDIIGKYVMYLVQSVKKQAAETGNVDNTDIEVLTITKPVGIAEGQMMASDYSRLLKDKMIEITGLNPSKIHLIDEPVAAAISYLYEQDINKKINGIQNVLVFDLGGGTLDTTVVRYNPLAHSYEIVVKDGDLELGGKDWDDVLGNLMLSKYEIDSNSLTDEEKGNFWSAITELKIGLSTRDEDVQQFKYGGGNKVYLECSVEEFEEACSELLTRSQSLVKHTIDQLEGGIDSLDGIIMVGGSSNMPMIKKMISSTFPEFESEKIMLYKPSKAIARGAAIYSYFNSAEGGVTGGAKILDSANCSYGFRSYRGGKDLMIFNGILKGDRYENGFISYRSGAFSAMENDQKHILIEMYESAWSGKDAIGDDDSEYDSYDEEDERWMPMNSGEKKNGQSVRIQVPPEYMGHAKSYNIYIDFKLSQDGILDITVYDDNENKVGFMTNA